MNSEHMAWLLKRFDMADQLSINRLQRLHPKLRNEALQIFDEINRALTGRAICRISYALRTFQEQQALFMQGRSKPGPKVTNARGIPGQSYHCYGLALDFVLLYDKDGNGTYETAVWDIVKDFDGDKKADWMEVVAIFKKYNWEWGGDWKFKDYPHVQKVGGKTWQQLWDLHIRKKVDREGYVLI